MKDGGNYVMANGKEDLLKNNRLGMDQDSDDSKDSDAVQLFELPKRKLVRPMSSNLRRKVRNTNKCWNSAKECCRLFATVTVPMLIAIFIVSTILCLAFLLIGIAGMKQEITVLKSRLKNVDAAEQNFLAKKEKLRKQFRDKLNNLVSYQTELQKVQDSVKKLTGKIDTLNSTIHTFHRKPTSQLTSKVANLKKNLDTVTTGMADTGSEIEKLKADSTEIDKEVKWLLSSMASVKRQMYNMTVHISLMENKKPPPLKTTPKVLVVQMTSDLDKPVKRREINKMLEELEKRQTDHCQQEVLHYKSNVDDLYNKTLVMNETYFNELSSLRQYIHLMSKPKVVETGNATTVPPPPTVATSTSNITVNATKSVTTNITIPLLTKGVGVHSSNISVAKKNSTSIASLTRNETISDDQSKNVTLTQNKKVAAIIANSTKLEQNDEITPENKEKVNKPTQKTNTKSVEKFRDKKEDDTGKSETNSLPRKRQRRTAGRNKSRVLQFLNFLKANVNRFR